LTPTRGYKETDADRPRMIARYQNTVVPQGFLAGEPSSVAYVEEAVERALAGRSLNLGDAREDVRQEALRRLVVSFRAGQFRGDSSLSTYIHKVAHGAAIDHWRRVRRRREESAPENNEEWQRSTPADQSRDLEAVETRRLVDRVLGAIGSPCRELLARVYFDEAPYAVIAETQGRTEGAVKVQVHRCRQEAARLLRRIGEERLVTRSGHQAPNPPSAQ
jgi:RNA polymerase sigma-70 factor, ECF subfamily